MKKVNVMTFYKGWEDRCTENSCDLACTISDLFKKKEMCILLLQYYRCEFQSHLSSKDSGVGSIYIKVFTGTLAIVLYLV